MEPINKNKLYKVYIRLKNSKTRAEVIVDPKKQYGNKSGLDLIKENEHELII